MTTSAPMCTPNRIALADCLPQPWRNGGGTTRELLAWPRSGDWLVRVSVAEIARTGDFSSFPGVMRCFAVLEGAGVELALPGRRLALTAHSEPVQFDGALAPHCRLLDGPTQDLNFMVHQDAGRAHMRRAPPGSRLSGGARWRGLYAADALQLEIGSVRREALAAGTLLWSDAGDAAAWTVREGDRAWWLALEAA